MAIKYTSPTSSDPSVEALYAKIRSGGSKSDGTISGALGGGVFGNLIQKQIEQAKADIQTKENAGSLAAYYQMAGDEEGKRRLKETLQPRKSGGVQGFAEGVGRAAEEGVSSVKKGLGQQYNAVKTNLKDLGDYASAGFPSSGPNAYTSNKAADLTKGLASGLSKTAMGTVGVGMSPFAGLTEANIPVVSPFLKGVGTVLSKPGEGWTKSTDRIAKAFGVDTESRDYQEGFAEPSRAAVDLATFMKAPKFAEKVGTKVESIRTTAFPKTPPPTSGAAGIAAKKAITVDRIVGQIIQGAPKDKAPAAKALADIDLKGVKTYVDLNGKTKSRISDLASKQDSILDADMSLHKPADVSITAKVPGSTEVVSFNPVVEALIHLGELNQNSPVQFARLKSIFNKLQEDGLTSKELNQVAREYNTEFHDKAFTQLGEPKTSVSAIKFEDTRSGIKEVVRGKMNTPLLKDMDAQMSNLYVLSRATAKMVKAVNNLSQKIQPRTFLQKLGRAIAVPASIVMDKLGIQAFVTKLLHQSDVGKKQMNSLAIEESLIKNLSNVSKLLEMTDIAAENALVKMAKEQISERQFKEWARDVQREQDKLLLPEKGTPGRQEPIIMNEKSQRTIDAEEMANPNIKTGSNPAYTTPIVPKMRLPSDTAVGPFNQPSQISRSTPKTNTTIKKVPIPKSIAPASQKVKSTKIPKPFRKSAMTQTRFGQAKVKSGDEFSRENSLPKDYKDIETKAFDKILKNEQQILDDYKIEYGKTINTDNFRPFFEKEGYNGSNAAAVQEPASYLAKRAYTEGLKNDGIAVVGTGGGSGVGKSSALDNIPSYLKAKDGAVLILDSNLSSWSSLQTKVAEARAVGKDFIEYFVYRNPEDAFLNGVIKRMKTNPKEKGRLVPSKVVAKNHIESWSVARKFEDEGGTVYYIDNSLGFNKAAPATRQALEAKIKYPSEAELINRFNKIAKDLYDKGELSPAEYRGYTQ